MWNPTVLQQSIREDNNMKGMGAGRNAQVKSLSEDMGTGEWKEQGLLSPKLRIHEEAITL